MILSLTLSQSNVVEGSNLLPVHNPLIFICQAEYSGTPPDYIYADLYDKDDILLNTFKCIPYRDPIPTYREFLFIADKILKGYMDGLDDFVQGADTLEHVDNMTMEFKIVFRDPESNSADVEFEMVAIHAANQFGQNPNLHEVFNNETDTYIAYENKPVYIYFYNDNIANVLSVLDTSFQEVVALDYDDEEFADQDDVLLTIETVL